MKQMLFEADEGNLQAQGWGSAERDSDENFTIFFRPELTSSLER